MSTALIWIIHNSHEVVSLSKESDVVDLPHHTHTLEWKDRKTCTLKCRDTVRKLKISHVKNVETRKTVLHQ